MSDHAHNTTHAVAISDDDLAGVTHSLAHTKQAAWLDLVTALLRVGIRDGGDARWIADTVNRMHRVLFADGMMLRPLANHFAELAAEKARASTSAEGTTPIPDSIIRAFEGVPHVEGGPNVEGWP